MIRRPSGTVVGIPWVEPVVVERIPRLATEHLDQNLVAGGAVVALARTRRGHRLPLLQDQRRPEEEPS